MMPEADLIATLAARAATLFTAHEEELTTLDRAIGDGDHGANLRRGFDAVASEPLSALPLGEALKKAGMVLVMKVGGASGPLYGSALMAMGKAADSDASTLAHAAFDAVKARGKAEPGAKTMLDVLAPVAEALGRGGGIAEVRAAADAGLEATRPMRATKGRAAFLGERSIGHLDPGARSSALLIHLICDVLEGK